MRWADRSLSRTSNETETIQWQVEAPFWIRCRGMKAAWKSDQAMSLTAGFCHHTASVRAAASTSVGTS